MHVTSAFQNADRECACKHTTYVSGAHGWRWTERPFSARALAAHSQCGSLPFLPSFPGQARRFLPFFACLPFLRQGRHRRPSRSVTFHFFLSSGKRPWFVGVRVRWALLQAHCGGMFYHAVHLLNHGSALESGTLGLHGAQFCALAGDRDAGVVCTCASRVLSCPEPSIVGTTKGLHVDLPQLGNKASVKAFLAKHPNNAYLVCCARPHRFATALFLGLRSFPWIPLSSAWPQADRRRRCPLYLAA